jgi:subtilase family serine protease
MGEQLMKHPRMRLRVLLTLGALAGVVAALAASAGGSSAASTAMAPASGPSSLYMSVGSPLANPSGSVHFGCQLAAPPVGPCYGPDQIRAAYGIQPLLDQGYDGSGRTIVIIDAYGSPTLSTDVQNFDTVWGLPAPDLAVVAPFGIAPTDPANAAGWAGETSLDVEWAHAVARGSMILGVGARTTHDSDILDVTQWVRDQNAGDVLSQSYGEAEQCMGDPLLARQHSLFADLTGEGMTLFASSGDAGAGQFTCDGNALLKAVSTPASDPYVTGVGGTTLIADGVSGAYASESAWNETELLGGPASGGGGVSVVYSRPSYQAPVQKSAMRTVPDVSYNAAVLEGVVTAWGGDTCGPAGTSPCFWRFGGTSAGSPQWAALTAIADQIAGGRVGAINKALYDVGKNSRQGTYFHDVADGSNNSVPDLGPGTGTPIDGFTAVSGYDLVTGLGTPVANTLIPYLAKHASNGNDNYGSVASSIGAANGNHKHPH